MTETSSDPGQPDKREHSRWLPYVAGFVLVGLIGMYAAMIIPAVAGISPRADQTMLGAMFWTGCFWYLMNKQAGRSSVAGWFLGFLVGFIVYLGVAMLAGYQRGLAANEVNLAIVEDQIAVMNRDLPQMVDDDLRADRIAWGDDGYQYFLSFPNFAVSELDVESTSNDYREYFTEYNCSTPELETALSEGLTLHYFLSDKDGVQVTDFILSNADCN